MSKRDIVASELKNLHSNLKEEDWFITGKIPGEIKDNFWAIYNNPARPATLYKFFSCKDYHIEAYKKSQIYLSHRDDFNDPFDSFPCAKEEDIEGFITEYSEYLNARPWWKDWMSFFTRKTVPKTSEEIRYIVKKSLDCFKDRGRMACFTETILNPLLWAHYADSYKGFVLKFDTNSLLDRFCRPCALLPIIYYEKRFRNVMPLFEYISRFRYDDKKKEIAIFDNSDLVWLSQVYVYKSPSWRYEQEWRFLLCDNEAENRARSDVFLENCRPSEIILGSEIREEHKLELKRITQELNKKHPDKIITLRESDIHNSSDYSIKLITFGKNK